jgi:signal transduction histidine kinase
VTRGEWEGVLDALAAPILQLDPDGVVLRRSGALADLLQQSGIGVHWRALLGPRRDPGANAIERCLQQGSQQLSEETFAHLPGIWLVAASPYQTPQGRSGAVVVLHDVTEWRRQQEQVFEAARLAEIGQLAGGIAHEINTPLASIALRAESLLKLSADPELRALPRFERFPRYLATIDQEIFRCKRIITSLLDFARSGRHAVEPTDLNALIQGALDLVGHAIRRARVSVELQLAARLPPIQADASQLRQVALALLTNALEAAGDDGVIRVATGADGAERVSLEVTDRGSGIPREERERIFQPFYSTKGPTGAAGLGLAVCRQIVAAHGGQIEVEDPPGGGTLFRVRLPLRGAEPGAGAQP